MSGLIKIFQTYLSGISDVLGQGGFQKILGHDRLMTPTIYLNFTEMNAVNEYSVKWC